MAAEAHFSVQGAKSYRNYFIIMIIFLYGEDSYRSKQKLDEIISHYKEIRKSGLNLMQVDAEETDFPDFYNNFKVSSMFAETKLIILKNIFANAKFQENVIKEITYLQASKEVIVVYEAQALDQRLKLYKLMLKEAKSQEFALLDSRGLKNFAQKEFEKMGAKIYPVKSSEAGVAPKAQQFNRINNDALDLLLSYVGADTWQLHGEIKKLADFKNGAAIQKADVELLVKPNIQKDIFKTIDALAQRNPKQALHLLHKHLDGGDNALYLLSMIGYQFRNLLVVKELQEKGLMYASIVKKSGLHPFVVKKSYFQCRQFTFLELKNIYHRIFKIDSDIKVGKIEAETALDLLVSQI